MNVLLLTTTYPPEIRSAALLMQELAESLAQRGHRVTVITGKVDEGPERTKGAFLSAQAEERSGVRVIRVPNFAIHKTHAPAVVRGLGQLLNAMAYFWAALSVKDVDISLAYSPPLALGIVGAMLHRLKGVPHVLNVQDLVPQYAIDLGILRNKALIAVLKRIEKAVYRNVQLITVHSRGNAEYMVREGVPPQKVAVVPNWVDTRLIRPAPRQTAYRHAAGLDGKFVALFAGMLGFAQDVDTIVEAGAYLKDHPEIVLLIVGEGVEKQRLQEKAKALGLDNVRFMPFVNSQQYPEVVASADLCLATLQKTLLCPVVPSKLLGYMAAGRPIVASFPENGDAPRVVREAGAGICVPPGEPKELARAILEAYRDPEGCRAWGEQGRVFVESTHDRNRVMDLYVALFRGVLGCRTTTETSERQPDGAAAHRTAPPPAA
jgi:glycosyltransferase involved in cell wall biosynthesis